MTDRQVIWAFAAIWCVVIASGAVLTTPGTPQAEWSERQWSEHLAQQMGAQSEAVMHDLSRADILTEHTAYEVEWSDKKGESLYQALSYMLEANTQEAAIILICRGDYQKDRLQISRVVSYLRGKGVPIRLETVKAPK